MEEQEYKRDGVKAATKESGFGNVNSSTADGLTDGASGTKRAISVRKLAANRANAQRSTGPRTKAGKTKSARNSLKHGLCSQHLFLPGPQGALDRQVYEKWATRLRDHYHPEGALERLLVEKLLLEIVRYARINGLEQQALCEILPFERTYIDKILRYSTSNEHELMRSIRELERIQPARKGNSSQFQVLRAGAHGNHGILRPVSILAETLMPE